MQCTYLLLIKFSFRYCKYEAYKNRIYSTYLAINVKETTTFQTFLMSRDNVPFNSCISMRERKEF